MSIQLDISSYSHDSKFLFVFLRKKKNIHFIYCPMACLVSLSEGNHIQHISISTQSNQNKILNYFSAMKTLQSYIDLIAQVINYISFVQQTITPTFKYSFLSDIHINFYLIDINYVVFLLFKILCLIIFMYLCWQCLLERKFHHFGIQQSSYCVCCFIVQTQHLHFN